MNSLAIDSRSFYSSLYRDLAEELRGSLKLFIQAAWPIIEPTTPLKWNWHLDEICELLESVSTGHIKKLIINVPPGTGKPVHEDELIYCTRGFVRLADVKIGDKVLTHRGRFKRVIKIYDQGVIPTVTVRTHHGREVRAGLDHPFLTPRGWVEAQCLTDRDYVGFPRRKEKITQELVAPEEARLLGYLVGDGSLTTKDVGLTNEDEEIISDFCECANTCGFSAVPTIHRNPNVKAKYCRLTNIDRRPGHGVVTQWLRYHGLEKSSSYTKRIPPFVLASSPEIVSNFLGAYFSCDGTFNIRHVGKKMTMQASATTVSEELAKDLLRAFSILNINCRIRTKRIRLESKKQPGGTYVSYNVVTTERNEVHKIARLKGLCSRKRTQGEQAFRDRFEPEVYADPVVEVIKSEPGHCLCLAVEDDHSFTANCIAVHNSRTLAFWNAWEWTRDASLRYLTSSHSKDLTIRDNLDVRSIVSSEWYQRLFWTDPDNPDNNVSLADDQYAKIRFNTTARGYRIATSVGGHGVGEHPDRIVLDDLITPQDARSDIALDNANTYLQNTISTRVRRDPAIVLIMQRLHENDPTGFLLSKPNHGFTHVVFPMHYAIPKQDANGVWSGGIDCDCHRTRPDPLDHRTIEGELLWSEEFTEARVEAIETLLGPIDSAGQLEQNPSLATGTLYSRDMFTIIDALPREALSAPSARGWDTADTDIANERKKRRKGDWTVGVKVTGPIPSGPFAGKWIVAHVIRLKGKPQEVDTTIINTAVSDGKSTKVREGAGVGKDTIDRRTQELAGWDYEGSPETDSKIERNRPFRVQATSGNVLLLRGEWNTPYLDVLCSFPTGRFDDDVDATSNAFNALAVRPRRRLRYVLGT